MPGTGGQGLTKFGQNVIMWPLFRNFMKKDIHPNYCEDAKVTCACGNTFTVGSTMKEIRVELCNLCHPFYTGKQKFVDTARRVEKYQEKVAKIAGAASARKGKKVKHAAKTARRIAKTSGTKDKKKL